MDSDIVPIELNLNLKISPTKPTRKIIFDCKKEHCKQLFKQLTSEISQFTECFKTMQPLQLQCENWNKTITAYCEKAFPLIRVRTGRLKLSQADTLIKERNILKKRQDDKKTCVEEDVKLISVEENIAEILAEEGRSKAYQFKKVLLSKWFCQPV